MAFSSVSVIQVRDAPRRWMQSVGERRIAGGAGLSRGRSSTTSLQRRRFGSPEGGARISSPAS